MITADLTDILCPFSNRTTEDSNELVSIEPDLDPVVEQGEEGSKREGRHKDGHKPVLDHWVGTKEQTVFQPSATQDLLAI